MANKTAAKKRTDTTTGIGCRAIRVRSAFPDRNVFLVYPGEGLWRVDGPIGPRPLSPRVQDLLDLVGGIYRIESQIPRTLTNPVREWRLEAAVRDVEFWSSTGGHFLASVLGFMNRSLWTIQFRQRNKAAAVPITLTTSRVDEIILFSGGMDSASGAGVHKTPKDRVRLVSFASTQAKLQRELAEALGYGPPVQWRLKGHRGKEGMDLLRSLMFLTLGAIVAESFGVSTIYQYENGLLAAAIPPAGNFIPTRHAHPELHRRLEQLFSAVFAKRSTIVNPFAQMTKREVVDTFSKTCDQSLAENVLRKTQTCWRLSQPTVGGKPKEPWVPCGVCTPCIVRRTARPNEVRKGAWKDWKGYAYDLKKRAVQADKKLGRSFGAHLELVEIALNSTDDYALIEELAPEARQLVGAFAGPTVADAASLLRRFALEFCDTFDISVAGSLS
jgi:7-cyano-7-deazaguanine synthase in queuosine biosynthesis